MEKKVIGTCQLCLEEKQLQKSHIIPEYIYKRLQEDFHIEPLKVVHMDLDYFQRDRKGDWDNTILCPTCDNKIGKYDEAFKLFIETQPEWKYQPPTETQPFGAYSVGTIENFDKIKLFFISLLWRAHLSIKPTWKAVDMGPLASRARDLILANNPGTDHDFSVMLNILRPPKNEPLTKNHMLIISPSKEKSYFDGITTYVFYLTEFTAYIKCSNRPWPNRLHLSMLHENKNSYIIETPYEGSLSNRRFAGFALQKKEFFSKKLGMDFKFTVQKTAW